MVIIKYGSIFDSETEALVNPVNCVGVMGKGLALEFKKRYPLNFQAYEEACNSQRVKIGSMFVTTGHSWPSIVNFPTKRHWRNPSRMEDIIKGLEALRRHIWDTNLTKISMPAVGCGLGGLRFDEVRPEILYSLEDLDCEVSLYPPGCG